MGLPVPREPIEIKEFVKVVRRRLTVSGSSSDVDYDSLAVWSFNRLPKYLWEQWKTDLKSRGITWQKFLRILKLHTIDMIEWALRDSLSWNELVKRIENSVNNYSSASGGEGK